MKSIWVGIIGLLTLTGCGFKQLMVERADGTKYPLPLPKHCTPVEELHLKRSDIRLLSDYISNRNGIEWRVDIRRQDVCIARVITHDHLGLFKINSIVSSHWAPQYFINGRLGVSPIPIDTARAKQSAIVQAALTKHTDDFSTEEKERILHYFIK